jgi:hypothetical protein
MAPPPGYVGYGGAGAAMGGQSRKVGGVAKALRVLTIIFIPMQIVAIVSLFMVRNNARDFLNGAITEKKFTDTSQANLGALAGVLIIPIAVLTIILMFRMAQNLRNLGRADATWKPGWAIAGWFCPPCAVYAIPWLMFRELWKGSDPAVPPNDPSWKSRPVSPLINVWWVTYGLLPLIGLFTLGSFFSNVRSIQAEDLARRYIDYLWVNVALGVVQIVSGVVFLMMISQLSARHMTATREA